MNNTIVTQNRFKSASVELLTAFRTNDIDRAIRVLDSNNMSVTYGTDSTRSKFMLIHSKSGGNEFTKVIFEELKTAGVGMRQMDERPAEESKMFLTIYMSHGEITNAVVGYSMARPVEIRE